MPLKGKNIVLGVTGGIAAYKACELTSRLRKAGAQVYVIMTKNACQFVAPLTFETLSNHPVVTDTFARPDTWEVEHIALAKKFAELGCEAKVKEMRSVEDGKEYIAWVTVITTTPSHLWEISSSLGEELHIEQLYKSVDIRFDTVIWPEE